MLKLALDGLLYQRKEAHQDFTEVVYEFQDEIADYFREHLPEHNKIFGESAISGLKEITEELFTNSESPRVTELPEYIAKLSLAADFIPADQQDV